MTIQETAAAAKAEGLSYGQYVDAHKDDAPAESSPETTTRTCAHCGKEFPVGKRQSKKIYCCTHCRDAAAGPRVRAKAPDQTAKADGELPCHADRTFEVRVRFTATHAEVEQHRPAHLAALMENLFRCASWVRDPRADIAEVIRHDAE